MKISGIIKEEACYKWIKFCAILRKFAKMARLLVFNGLISSERSAHCPPDFINKDAWPPNSPDLNLLDYHVWGWSWTNPTV